MLKIQCDKYNVTNTMRQMQWEQAGLSWGSVQAETVRLQRQSEPGLKDIHMKLTEILSEECLIIKS